MKDENKGLKNIHYGLIHNGLPVNMDIRDSRLPVVKDLNSIKSYTLCQNGDVVFADASEDTYDVAKAIEIINCRDDKVICGLHTIHGRDKMNITALGFKGHYFSSPSFHKRIQRIAQGTKVFSVSIKNFNETYIDIPSKEEQQKIVTLLNLIDERIATKNKIIEELKKLRGALIEQLFNDNDGWNSKPLNDLCMINNGLSITQNGLDKGFKVTRIETISNRNINIKKVGFINTNVDISDYKLKTGDILFSNINSPEHIGKTAFVDRDYDLYHGMNLLKIRPTNNLIHPYFLFIIFNTKKAKILFQSICNKAVSQASINQTELGNFIIYYPQALEQEKIASTIKCVEDIIDIEVNKLTNYFNHKQYLLNNLFI